MVQKPIFFLNYYISFKLKILFVFKLDIMKHIINNKFKYFFYFYSYLKYRIFLLIFLSVLVGVLDGFGLALFLPLIEVTVEPRDGSNTNSLGEFSFLLEILEKVGIGVSVSNILLFMTFLFMLKGILKFLDSYYKIFLQITFVKGLRFQMLDGLENVNYRHFITMDAGRIQNTLSGEVYKVTSTFISYFNTLQFTVLLLVYTFMAFVSDWKFALLVTLGGAISNLIFKILFRKTEVASILISEKGHLFQSFLIQCVHYFKYLKATSYFSIYKKKLVNEIIQIEDFQKKIGFYNSLLNGLREPMILTIVLIVIAIKINFLGGSISGILLSLMFFYRSLNYVISIQSSWQSFISQFGGISSTTNLIKMFEEDKENFLVKNAIDKIGMVELRNLNFSFNSKVKIIDNVSLKIKPKEAVALIGPSGSGKTTLVNLIVGLLQPSSGEIFIDDVELSKIGLKSYRRKVGYITQEPVIFNDTLFNNVTFWSERTPEVMEKFYKAITLANLNDFVSKLELQENTLLGDNGVKASGGQRQRISIARELFKEVDIIIFDEATSSLDSESESIIQENINLLKGKYTLILIAHRLSTIKNVNCIYLIQSGKVIDYGDFDLLMDKNEYFYKMVKLQGF